MVNSPSPLNSCPVDPPATVECGGLTPLWNWETCLPVDPAAWSAPVPRHALVLPPPGTRRARGGDYPVTRMIDTGPVTIRKTVQPPWWPSARTKAKTPAIKADHA